MGAKNQCCSTTLAVIADRQKLPPDVAFKHKTMEKEKFLRKLKDRQKSGWMITTGSDLYGFDDWVHSYNSYPCWF
jgi:hypothetical protein